jgi:hypothetical protein
MNSGVFPDKWKTAKVKTLYKKGDRYDMLNCRPISIISAFDKLLERYMYNRIIYFHKKTRFLQNLEMVLRKENLFSHLLK